MLAHAKIIADSNKFCYFFYHYQNNINNGRIRPNLKDLLNRYSMNILRMNGTQTRCWFKTKTESTFDMDVGVDIDIDVCIDVFF